MRKSSHWAKLRFNPLAQASLLPLLRLALTTEEQCVVEGYGGVGTWELLKECEQRKFMQASTRGKKKKSSLKSGKKGAGERSGACRKSGSNNCIGGQKSSYGHPDTSTIQDAKAQGLLLRWAWGAGAILLAVQKPLVRAPVPAPVPMSPGTVLLPITQPGCWCWARGRGDTCACHRRFDEIPAALLIESFFPWVQAVTPLWVHVLGERNKQIDVHCWEIPYSWRFQTKAIKCN